MLQNLFELPVYIVAAVISGLAAASLLDTRKKLLTLLAAVLTAAGVCIVCFQQSWGQNLLPVRGYGAMILAGFLLGTWLSARRARRVGIEPHHVYDMGIGGVLVGLAGARIFHVAMNWREYNPLTPEGFDYSHILDMFKLWEGGLVFYGAFLTVIPWAWTYCWVKKIPILPFLDICAPGLMAGLSLGRIGCFLNGCCYGKICTLPWAVQFPAKSPAWNQQLHENVINTQQALSLPLHPTQLYACVAAALSTAFLYAWWPRRSFNGQIVALMMLMAGSTRFFEELLRDDEVAVFPTLSNWMTIAQWVALGIMALGFLLLFVFSRRKTPLLNVTV